MIAAGRTDLWVIGEREE